MVIVKIYILELTLNILLSLFQVLLFYFFKIPYPNFKNLMIQEEYTNTTKLSINNPQILCSIHICIPNLNNNIICIRGLLINNSNQTK